MPQRRSMTRGQVRAYAFTPGDAPAEIKLWNRGQNATDYGIHLWTENSAASVMADYERRGNPLQVDVEHNSAKPPTSADDIGPTGGYARLELRSGEPWLVFDWSEYAVEQLRSKQRRFLSPEYDVDKQSGEITRLVRVSLVADPGTHNARMLASARRRVRAGRTETMDMKLFLAALKAALKAKDPGEAVGALVAEVEGVAGEGEEPGAESTPTPGLPQAAAADGGLPGAEGEKKPVAAADDKGPPADDEQKKLEAACMAAARPAAVTADEKELAKRVAQLERDHDEREAEARFTAASPRIPESLHKHARKLASAAGTAEGQKDWTDFLAAFPAKGAGGIKAASGRSQGEAGDVRAARLPDEDAKHMKRVFATADRPTTPFTLSRSGGVTATHMFRPTKAIDPDKLVQSIKEA